MQNNLAFIFPGQGSQAVAMLSDFSDNEIVQSTFVEASAALGYDLWELISQGPVEKLNQRHGHYLDISVLACGEQLCELQLLGKFTEAYRDYGREIIDAVKTQADLKHSLQSPIGQNSDADMQPLLMVFCRQSCTL